MYGVMPHAPSKYFPVPIRPSGWRGHFFWSGFSPNLNLNSYLWIKLIHFHLKTFVSLGGVDLPLSSHPPPVFDIACSQMWCPSTCHLDILCGWSFAKFCNSTSCDRD